LNVQFTTKPYLPALVVSVVLFISVFLPWVSIDVPFFGSITDNGTTDWGVMTLITSILGAALSFLAVERARSLGILIAGILALLGVVLYWIHIMDTDMAGIGFGLIIALIASLALIYIGFMDYRKVGSAAPPPPPPAPPAPPAQ
jgi:hypothetical protein